LRPDAKKARRGAQQLPVDLVPLPFRIAFRLMSQCESRRKLNGRVPRCVFDRRLNLEFHGSRIELEGATMDFKKLIADLAARYRRLTKPISSSSLTPPGQVADVDAAHEAGRKAGYEVGQAEGYEAGYKNGYGEGLQVGQAAKTPPEPSGLKSLSEPPPESPPPSLSLYERLGGVYSIATVIDDFIDRIMIDPRLNANPRVDEAHHRVPLQASNISSRKCFVGRPAGRKNTQAAP
jgi:hypothetical protein